MYITHLMRSAFFCVLFLVYSNHVSKGQRLAPPISETSNLTCIYKLTYQPDSSAEITKTEDMILLIGKTISKFQSRGTYLFDSLGTVDAALPFNKETAQFVVDRVAALPRTMFRYTIYKTPATGQLYCYDKIAPTLYKYDEPANIFKWVITPSKSIIAGYACQRATTTFSGREFEAWFTREIPLAEGPYKFYGLPGLIVKVSDTRNHYQFELRKLTKSITPVIIALPTKKVTFTTKAKLVQAQKADELTIMDRMAAMGNTFSEAERRAAQERAKRRNNPLELK